MRTKTRRIWNRNKQDTLTVVATETTRGYQVEAFYESDEVQIICETVDTIEEATEIYNILGGVFNSTLKGTL